MILELGDFLPEVRDVPFLSAWGVLFQSIQLALLDAHSTLEFQSLLGITLIIVL